MQRSLQAKDQRVPRARRLRRDVTDAERKLWRGLRSLPTEDSHFRRQAPIGPCFADFACHAKRLSNWMAVNTAMMLMRCET